MLPEVKIREQLAPDSGHFVGRSVVSRANENGSGSRLMEIFDKVSGSLGLESRCTCMMSKRERWCV